MGIITSMSVFWLATLVVFVLEHGVDGFLMVIENIQVAIGRIKKMGNG